jgi:hypothetical protein
MKLALFLFFLAFKVWGQAALATNSEPVNSISPGELNQASTNRYLSPSLQEQVRTDCINGRRSICGKVLAVLPDGLVIESGYTNLLRQPLTSSWLLPGTVTASREINQIAGVEAGSICFDTVYLTDYPKSKKLKPKRYDYVIIEGYPAGQYTYNSLGSIHKTIHRFSAQLSKAVELNLQSEQRASPSAVGGK